MIFCRSTSVKKCRSFNGILRLLSFDSFNLFDQHPQSNIVRACYGKSSRQPN